jgi:23S rRNA pseudouridine2605 synthase
MVPLPGHLFPVGRLDLDSEGLLLMTNDGELANQLTHPRYGHEKEYRVQVDRPPDARELATWRKGVVLPDGNQTLPARVAVEPVGPDGAWLRIVMREGKKRQIRAVAGLFGLRVRRLIRVRMASLTLGDLAPGEWRTLEADEIELLREGTAVERDT